MTGRHSWKGKETTSKSRTAAACGALGHIIIMNEPVRQITNPDEVRIVLKAMHEYQSIHNLIRKEFSLLLTLTDQHRSNDIEFKALCNTCLRSLFSIIEADIYGLNRIVRYDNYNDNHCFETKFKRTIKNVSEKCQKCDKQRAYFDSKYFELKELRKKRDRIIHPKEICDIANFDDNDFLKIKKVFNDYCDLIHNLMKCFFIGFDFKTLTEALNKNVS
jgi:hypothetical protein